jgi:hypothetical protein
MNVTPRSLITVAAILACSITVSAHGRRQYFFFIEESWRLPPDISLPRTSNTDVDLVDVDDDGDLDLVVGNSGETVEIGQERVFVQHSRRRRMDR